MARGGGVRLDYWGKGRGTAASQCPGEEVEGGWACAGEPGYRTRSKSGAAEVSETTRAERSTSNPGWASWRLRVRPAITGNTVVGGS